MKKWSLLLLPMLCAEVALAEPPAPLPDKLRDAASSLVNKQVVQLLKKADAKRSKFSRAAPPPKARRVRVLDTSTQVDVIGKRFVRFAIDVQHRFAVDDEWSQEALLGCVYVDDKLVFLEQGSDYLPVSSALSGEGEPIPDVCRAAPEDAAGTAS